MTLTLISFRPDFSRLMALATREKLLPQGGSDLGYALHAIFTASFGALAPKPFRLFDPGVPGGGPSGRLLAYSPEAFNVLRDHATTFADPAFSAPLCLDEAEAKTMPTQFPAGTRLGFNLRLRPIQRTGASPDGSVKARERDVYQGPATADEPARLARIRTYGDWLGCQLGRGDAARLEAADAESLDRTRLLTRNRSGEARKNRSVDGPDVVFSGTLAVGDPDAFVALLTRGIGRFRAFGFGMLLIRPPG